MATGIAKRHSRTCRSRQGERCNCNAGWEASVFSKRENKKIRKTFRSEAEAKTWRADALAALSRGGLRTPKRTTALAAWDEWYEGAKAGTVRNVSGDPYKPSALRAYERAMRLRVLPALGAVRLAELHRPDVQALADRLLAEGLSPTTIRNTFLPLRAVCGRAVAADQLAMNPCDGIRLPAVRARRDRIVGVVEAEELLAAVPGRDRALWATAMFAGLRLGELQALRVESIDLAAGVIHVERGWDAKEGEIEPKSASARRGCRSPRCSATTSSST
jgi:integrase